MSISVSVDSEEDACYTLHTYPPGAVECIPMGCDVLVMRSWSGLPPDTELKFCRTEEGGTLCLYPSPTTGATGEGESTIPSTLDCGEVRLYSVKHPSWSLATSAQGSCSICTK